MVPNGWSLVKLGDILTLGSGDTKPDDLQKEYSDDSPYPVYGGNNIMGYSSQKNSSDSVILIGRVGEYCGVTRYIDKACWITDNALYTKKVSSEIDKEYLVSKLKKFDLSRLRNKGGQPLVSQKPIYAVKLPMPPLPEQRKIAKILSTWDKAIATAERLIAASQQQKKALMQQLLTGKKRLLNPETGMVFEGDWEEVKLGDVCSPQQWPTISSKDLLDEGFSVYGANGHIGFYSEFNHEYETVAVTCRGSTCGEVSLIPKQSYITGNAMCLDDIDSDQNSYMFIYYALCSRGFSDVISGSAQPQIVGKAIKSVKFVIPELVEQQKIASVLTAADKDIELLQAKLAHLKEEKKALMQQLLTGKRRVKVETTEEATC
ncbi:restriction endonuclease subunit S [Vibrio cholerae]|uniref:restriction endonuclease subunit S n=1 Tax=Vibrio cholerae TaxID=666 RepID=UPI0029D53BE3|nr:restriction endonuclease subunit S [Vibrio cholerae]EJL6423691.1 restriction endonuclease subunit S [Vibrio cholerae]HEJ2462487.1 restriction endonuclease subunit S [Vibrio cholerae]